MDTLSIVLNTIFLFNFITLVIMVMPMVSHDGYDDHAMLVVIGILNAFSLTVILVMWIARAL